MELTRTDVVFSRTAMVLFLCRNKSSRNDLKIHRDTFVINKKILVKESASGAHTLSTRVQGAPTPLGCAPCLVGPMWPPPLIPAPTHFVFLQKKSSRSSSPCSSSFFCHFDLLAQSSIHKTALGDCSLVCDSSNGPISFCSSALFIANFCCLGDPVLELACQIYMVPNSSNA